LSIRPHHSPVRHVTANPLNPLLRNQHAAAINIDDIAVEADRLDTVKRSLEQADFTVGTSVNEREAPAGYPCITIFMENRASEGGERLLGRQTAVDPSPSV
jgi:hypothetical protein